MKNVTNKTALIFVCFTWSVPALAIVNGVQEIAWENPAVVRLVFFEEKLTKEDIGRAPSTSPNRCTGIAVSDSLVVTAGHCINTDEGSNQSAIVVQEAQANRFQTTLAEEFFTEYIYEEAPDNPKNTLVPGCSIVPKPIFETKTLDMAVVRFPEGTFKVWTKMESNLIPSIKEQVVLKGYGSHYSSFVQSILHQAIRPNELKSASMAVFRHGQQRVLLFNPPILSYADIGDSGGPAFNIDGNVFGVISTVEDRCETEFGEDYAMVNGLTVFSSEQAKAFLEKAWSRLGRRPISF